MNLNNGRLLYEDDERSIWFAKADGGLIKRDKRGRITKFLYFNRGKILNILLI